MNGIERKAIDETNAAYNAASKTSTRTRLIVAGGVAVAAFAVFAFCAGEKREHGKDQHAAVAQILKPNTDSLVAAGTVAVDAHAGVVAAAKVVEQASAVSESAARVHHVARARVAVVNDSTVSIDSAPPVAVPAAVVATVVASDAAIAADSAEIQTRKAERDSLVADTVAIAHQRELYRERADTLQHALEQSSAGGCAKLCTIGKVTVYAVSGIAIYNIGRQLLRALFVGPAKP